MENLRGALLMVLAMAGFAIEDMCIKLMAGALPVGQILILLGAGGALAFGGVCIAQRRRLFPRAMLRAPLLLRNGAEVIGTLGFVTAITTIDLSVASAILQATPLVVTLGAALFLGEVVGWRRWSAILVGFAGVLVIIRPGLEGFVPASLFAVIGMLGLALRDLATRRVTADITSMQVSFQAFLMLIPTGAILMALAGDAPAPVDLRIGMILLAAISVGLVAYFMIVTAMRIGEVSFVTPFRYSRMIFALAIGMAVFGERPDAATWAGMGIIMASGLYTLWRERHVRQRPSAA
ncbi:DMT family transporter [Primorskyibacter aestuariivivens]|uniref:DMT family transporter n=1 Tax=Primorskyibacter aestuariivivens TaxID=1888912 RepID=UPI0023012449|nr:DMT family transporter [Primorskyibacter aestuariivivens]MDA7430321.1 DMT family transporter [Primorskyibacter aestuariivivens]